MLLPTCPLSTLRRQIVNRQGRPERLACLKRYEPDLQIPMTREIRTAVAVGFDCLRTYWVNATMQQDMATIHRVAAP